MNGIKSGAVSVRRVAALGLVLISCIAMGRMLVDMIGGSTGAAVCEPSDYNCNYERYMRDIRRKPPSFMRAETVAIRTDRALQSNLNKIQSLPDYEATSMLRVVNAYPKDVKRDLCQREVLVESLKRRGIAISSPYQRQEYSRIFMEMGCS